MSVLDADSRLDDVLQTNLVLLSDKLDGRAERLVTSYIEAAALCDEHDSLGGLLKSAVDSATDALDGWLGEFIPLHPEDERYSYFYDHVRGELREQLETAACELLGLAKVCSGCSAAVTPAEWSTLQLVGVQQGTAPLELRNHACGSTISLPAQVPS